METTTTTVETQSTSHNMTLDLATDDYAAIESSTERQEKNSRDFLKPNRAPKSQFLIVDEEWW